MILLLFALFLWLIALIMLVVGKISYQDSVTDKDVAVSLRPWSLIPGALGWLILLFGCYAIVSPDSVAVPVSFGHAQDAVGPGFHFKPPWVHYHSLSIKIQNYTMSSVAPEGAQQRDDSVPVHTKDQVTVGVDSTALFTLDRDHAKFVYVRLGSDYVDQVVRPIIRSAIRDNATPYNAIDLATDKRAVFQADVQRQVERGLDKYGIVLNGSNGVQIRDIHLPASIEASVNAKAKAQQDVVRQGFILQSKRAQAQQRIIEAQGLAKSQTIIKATLTPEYLRYLYISEMGKLAQSKNTTFLFLPSDPDNLPNFQIPLTTTK